MVKIMFNIFEQMFKRNDQTVKWFYIDRLFSVFSVFSLFEFFFFILDVKCFYLNIIINLFIQRTLWKYGAVEVYKNSLFVYSLFTKAPGRARQIIYNVFLSYEESKTWWVKYFLFCTHHVRFVNSLKSSILIQWGLTKNVRAFAKAFNILCEGFLT